MNAEQYRAAAIDLVIRLTGMTREEAEEIIDPESAAAWWEDWNTGHNRCIVASYVAAALLDHGYVSDGTYYGSDTP